MTEKSLEERVNELEQQLAELKATIQNGTHDRDWRRTVGMFTGDEVMKEIDEAGRQWRESERRKARRKPTKKQAAKKE